MKMAAFEKRELFTSYTAAMIALEQAVKEGWSLNPDDPPATFGFRFELPLVRDDEPKKTRAEVLEAARAAKAAKKEVQ
jgi:hypothetical protein